MTHEPKPAEVRPLLGSRCARCHAAAEVMSLDTWPMGGGFEQYGYRGYCLTCAERLTRDEARRHERARWEEAKRMSLVVITGLVAISRVTRSAWAIRRWRNGWRSTVSVDLGRWRLDLGPGVRA